MRAWTELTSAALRGTGKGAADAEAERRLLNEAAWYSLRRLAGTQPARFAAFAPTAAPEETRPLVSRLAAARLEEILRGDEYEHLGEWLEICASVDKRVPPSLLPPLLERGADQPALRATIVRAGGQRGAWLAQQNEEWSFAAIADPVEAFRSGVRGARVAALGELRRQDPAQALATLAAGWSQEGGDDRAALLPVLEVGLGPGDEEFLTRASDDGRKEVRSTAADLLARLPQSELIARMTARADGWIRFRRGILGGKLEVTPPTECDADMIADGIEPKAPKDVGERAFWMRQVIALVPPSHWPVEHLEAGAKSEWAEPLVQGWMESAARFGDPRWCVLLIEHQLARDDRKSLDHASFRKLIRATPADAIEAAILNQLKRNPGHALLLASGRTDRLSLQVSVGLMSALERVFTTRDQRQQELWITTLARYMRARLDPGIVPNVLALTDKLAQAGAPSASESLQSLAATLEYRAEMAKEILS